MKRRAISALECKNEDMLQFRVQGKERPKTIMTEMVLITKSKYSECFSCLLLTGWQSAYEYRSEKYLDQDNKEYTPLLDRFLLSGITVNDTVYLRRDDCSEEDDNQGTTSYLLPTADVHTSSDPMIVHGPDLINGYQDDDFFLGVISNVHNKPGTMYTWFHNGNPIHFGEFLSLIRVDAPGVYYCKLSYNQIELVSSSVNIEEVTNFAAKGGSKTKLETDVKYPASVSIASLVKAGKLAIPHKK